MIFQLNSLKNENYSLHLCLLELLMVTLWEFQVTIVNCTTIRPILRVLISAGLQFLLFQLEIHSLIGLEQSRHETCLTKGNCS